jgi:S-adenosylmethionine:tRNA-ribosyltransferase-isomerase (queuine synthetase)
MKKNTLILKPRPKLSLGDLILAVSSCTKNTKETVATVADLLASGQVRVKNDGRFTKARVC